MNQPTVNQTAKSIVVKLSNFQISQGEADRLGFWSMPHISVNAHILEHKNLNDYQKESQLAVRILNILISRAHLPFDNIHFTSKKIRDSIQKAIDESGLYNEVNQ